MKNQNNKPCKDCPPAKIKNDHPAFIEEASNSENTYFRTFSKDIDEDLLEWHWDDEDRLVRSLIVTDWQFQFDNKLPFVIPCENRILIKKGMMHRLIKGTGDLKIELTKLVK